MKILQLNKFTIGGQESGLQYRKARAAFCALIIVWVRLKCDGDYFLYFYTSSPRKL